MGRHRRTRGAKHAVLGIPSYQRLSMGSGKIDVPLAVDAVHFRCPDELAHRRAAFRLRGTNGGRRRATLQRISGSFQPVCYSRTEATKVVIAAVA